MVKAVSSEILLGGKQSSNKDTESRRQLFTRQQCYNPDSNSNHLPTAAAKVTRRGATLPPLLAKSVRNRHFTMAAPKHTERVLSKQIEGARRAQQSLIDVLVSLEFLLGRLFAWEKSRHYYSETSPSPKHPERVLSKQIESARRAQQPLIGPWNFFLGFYSLGKKDATTTQKCCCLEDTA